MRTLLTALFVLLLPVGPAPAQAGPTVALTPIVHRGYDGAHRESSLAGVERLAQTGVPYVELDTRWTADHVAVIWHDPALWAAPRCQGAGMGRLVAELRIEEVSATTCEGLPVASLVQLVGLLVSYPSVRLWLEPKVGDVPAVLAVTEPIRTRVTLESTVPAYLRTASTAGYVACYLGRPLADLLGGAKANGWPCVAPVFTDPQITRARVLAGRGSGIVTVPWTVNDPAALLRMCQAGVRSVITDVADAPGRIACSA